MQILTYLDAENATLMMRSRSEYTNDQAIRPCRSIYYEAYHFLPDTHSGKTCLHFIRSRTILHFVQLECKSVLIKKNKNNNNKTVIYHPESTTNFVQKESKLIGFITYERE